METREQLQGLIGEDYTLQWVIGHGGMSTVWLADDNRTDTEVAVKVLRPEFSDNDEFLARFRNEAVTAEGIRSDNIVATYDYREVPDAAGHTFCFIVMEYVRGESLADMLAREDSLPEDLGLDVLEQTAHGLSILHRDGLIHRDIKPGNLLITQNGQVKITDFGIAKAAAAVPLTRTGMVVGTAQYVSPEQAQGQEVGPTSDVYSLGVVGYEMLAGQRPFTGDSGVSVALAHVSNAPPALPTTISAPARELIGISLRKDPGTRFADGNEMALAISAVRLGHRPPPPASAAMNQLAPEPSPTASTHLLGQTAQPTTIRPATGTAVADHPRTAEQPAVDKRSRGRRSGGGFGIGILIALVLAGAIAAAIWAAASGVFERDADDEPASTTTTPPEIVTEWVTPSEGPAQPTAPATTAPPTVAPPAVTTGPQDPGPAPTAPADPPPTQDPGPAPTAPQQPPAPTAPTGAPADPGTGGNPGGGGTTGDTGNTDGTDGTGGTGGGDTGGGGETGNNSAGAPTQNPVLPGGATPGPAAASVEEGA